MKNLNKILIFLALTASFTSCSDDVCVPGKGLKDVTVTKEAVNPTELTHKFLKATGEFVVTQRMPLIHADEVYENLSDYLVIDIRSRDEYVEGHINGALYSSVENIVEFMEKNVSANAYKKIVIACHTGQSAGYVAGMLRTIGYNNIYVMKWGMNGWSNKFPNKWGANISNKLANKLEKKENPKNKEGKLPVIESKETLASAILEDRAKAILKKGWGDATISLSELQKDPSKYYIVNYWPKERYDFGHLKGAVQYTPHHDFRLDGKLKTLPTDKTIVVYCYTGQYASYTVAYLRILGYKAKTLTYGANGFMNSALIDKGWAPFTAEEAANSFPSISGENPTNAKAAVISAKTQPTKKKKVVKRKKKAVSGGCG
jgi:rhodanese-related sulfurtransferase